MRTPAISYGTTASPAQVTPLEMEGQTEGGEGRKLLESRVSKVFVWVCGVVTAAVLSVPPACMATLSHSEHIRFAGRVWGYTEAAIILTALCCFSCFKA